LSNELFHPFNSSTKMRWLQVFKDQACKGGVRPYRQTPLKN